MPRGVPKSGSASSLSASSMAAPPPTRAVSARSAKLKANASILEHDTDIDALIRKHDKKGARGFSKVRKTQATGKADQDHVKDQQVVTTNSEAEVDGQHGKDRAARSGGTKRSEKMAKADAEAAASPKRATTRTRSKAKTTRKAKEVNSADGDEVAGQATPVKAVLGESTRRNNRAHEKTKADDDDEKVSSSPSKAKCPSSERTGAYSSPKKRKAMPGIQISSFLENYDLEADNRIRMALKTLRISIDSARTQMHAKAIAKLPRTVRLMRLGEFVNDYGADVQAAVERAAVVANRAREGAWEEEKLQRKRKGDPESAAKGADDGHVKGKSARLNPEVETLAASSPRSASQKRAKGKRVVRKAKQPPKATAPQSPVQQGSSRVPSTALFTPKLAGRTVIAGRSSSVPALPPTPAGGQPRAARAGEQVQWTSMSGSPIIGIVAPDGTIHAMPRTIRRSPSAAKSNSRNWQPLTDGSDDEDHQDAAETSAHLLELAKGIDGFRRSRDSSGHPSKLDKKHAASANASPASQLSLHTAQASRRGTLEGFESDDGGSVFEEARSRPDDDEDGLGADDTSLPDEEAYTAQVMREEAQKRARMLASEPRIARSSASSRAFGGRSSGSSSGRTSNTTLLNGKSTRASHSTIRAVSHSKNSSNPASRSSSSSDASRALGMPSSPMVRNRTGDARMASLSSAGSSSPNKGRVSIVFGTGSRHRITHLGVEDLMRLPAHERSQMLDILEKLKRAQLSSDA